jgi:pimeloyl-ACP methyl ester carboxylesterase
MNLTERFEVALGKAQYFALTRGVALALGFRAVTAHIRGVDVPFLVRGYGVPMFLVHGFGGDKESWLLMAYSLQPGRTHIIPDLPGFGAAGEIAPEDASAKQQAATLALLMDHLGLARAHLVGNSMGGGICLRFAHDYPTRASSLTLIGSVGPVLDKSEVGIALDRGHNPLVTHAPDDLERLVNLVAERPLPTTRAIRRYLGVTKFAQKALHEALFHGWNEPKDGDGVPDDLESIMTPALVIHGVHDRVIHPSTGRALGARLPNARLEMMEGTGHVPQLERPMQVANWVDAFVNQVESRRTPQSLS